MVQLTSVSRSCSLGDDCLSFCAQWDEDPIAEQDRDVISGLEFYPDVTYPEELTNRVTA